MNPLRVLVIEDSEDDAALLVRQLKRGGYQLQASRVESADDMVRLLDEQQWDLIIADYSLPNFSADEALSIVRARGLDLPFIILSGTIGEETAVGAMRGGAHDYIMKGNSARLLPAIERELREARSRATRRAAQQALQNNERRFRALIEHSFDIIIVVDSEGTILYQSPSFQRALHESPSPDAQLQSHLHPDDVDIVVSTMSRPASEGPFTIEFRLLQRDGDSRSFEATVNNLLDNEAVQGIVFNCRDVTVRKQDERTIRYLAYYDALTGLPNRSLFKDRLGQALAVASRRGSRGLAVMFLDLDRFKGINDTLGHGIGDELLRLAADRLSHSLRQTDSVARLGGDEFLFLLPGIDSPEHAERLGRKINALFDRPFLIDGHELHITTSIGISLFPSDATDAETLIRNADTALYRAKAQGRNRCQLYSPTMNASAARRLTLENALRRAIESDELRLFYQPIVTIDGSRARGVEALLRWPHDQLGFIEPSEFIPMAEESGLIIPLSRWVYRRAFTTMAKWLSDGLRVQTMSVNVSAHRFNDCGLPQIIGDALAETGLDGRHVSIELTESVMMDDADATIVTLHELKKLGVSISIDDFGTGYSSLSYLKRLPIDTLKIDRSFVQHIPDSDDSAIASLIISMAHTMNLSVVAEGVESESQRAFLASKNCDFMQGYLFSPPVPESEVVALLER